ncbi:protein RRP6-like 2 [Pyrus communis]|uniref:protein RRP6-like 2 n=1 Tax=Pyrus communis TaxID=23211 RepID=UPI0035C0EB0E
MSQDAVTMDQSPPPQTNSDALQTLTKGALSSSISKLSGSSRFLPNSKDFYFYRNFDEFRVPIEQITKESQTMLGSIGSSAPVWRKPVAFPDDLDDAYDWLVNVNDEALERFDSSVDEFKIVRKEVEEAKRPTSAAMDTDDGFQLVCGKKKKGPTGSAAASGNDDSSQVSSAVKVASKDKKTVVATKPKVPFHIPSIRRPQEEFNILVNNANQPFEHVWLQRSEDGQQFLHPLEKLSVLDFVDNNIGDVESVKPASLESTPFKLVEEVKDLKELAAKLRAVNEFAVDLEHNQYRSFQGLTCLMQISTRTEDFIVDTLKLRIHVGPYLREVFKDPAKRKVIHGADRDIMWLQRDFGIYICNLFDTGQASRVLKLERNSLEYLLQNLCGVTANKEYQNADWRLRPLPEEMIRYAREDTHYLLHMYDLMRTQLCLMPKESENSDTPLVEVYKRSYDLCMHLYEKELLTENSYLHIYGLQGAGFNSQQLAIVSGLCEWRDVVARAEDESTGYILPNKTLLEIAKQMPVTTSKLKRLVKSKHPYMERNLGSVVSIIRHSMQNAAFFEPAVEHLKVARAGMASEENILVNDGSEALLPDQSVSNSSNGDLSVVSPPSQQHRMEYKGIAFGASELVRNGQGNSPETGSPISVNLRQNSVPGQSREARSNACLLDSAKVTGVSVQVQKKPSRAFSSLLGSAVPKRKVDVDKKGKEDNKLEQIRSSVNFPFHSFSGRSEKSKPTLEARDKSSETPHSEGPLPASPSGSGLGDIITLENDSDGGEPVDGSSETRNEPEENDSVPSALGRDGEDEPVSLSDLSSSFQKCFQSLNQNRKTREVEKSQESGGLQVKPFDYEAAKSQVIFGAKPVREAGAAEGVKSLNSAGKKKSLAGLVSNDDGSKELGQGRRRQAFPATGNRSATFR